jgi:ATP synthase protein I
MADPLSENHEELTTEIGHKAERKLEARAKRDRDVWFGLGMFGLVGWSVATPTILGIFLGLWLDSHFANGVSWTLTFLFIGIVLGCLNAWFWVKKESQHDRHRQ